MDNHYQNEFYKNFTNQFLIKVNRAQKVNKVKNFMSQIAENNSTFIKSPFFENFANKVVNKMEEAEKMKKVKQIVTKLKFTQLLKKIDFLNKTRRL